MSKFILIFVLFLITSAAASSEPLSVQPKEQTDKWATKWWMPRHELKLREKNEAEKINLVFLGDSITHFWENRGEQVWSTYYKSRNSLNIGFSGDRTENVLWRIQNGAIDDIDPKLLVLMIGTNNTGRRQDPANDTALGIKAIIDSVKSTLPNTHILLLAIFPRGDTIHHPLRMINDDINRIIQDYQDGKRVHYLNINHVFLDDKGNLSPYVMKDFLHPNPNQYLIWAQAMEPTISRLMGEVN